MDRRWKQIEMRTSYGLIILAAVVVVVAVGYLGQSLIEPDLPLLVEAGFTLQTITPNADGSDDITEYFYTLSDNARVSITFVADDGSGTFAFRDAEIRAKGEYSGLFSGVVDGYVVDGETFAGEVMRRLMPNGDYTWTVQAISDTGEESAISGSLAIRDADAQLPDLTTFTVSPAVFTPNQDGIRDRSQINVYLEKAADLDVFLLTGDGVQIYIPPEINETRDGEAGRYRYDYDGGVDGGADPPPDTNVYCPLQLLRMRLVSEWNGVPC